MLITKETAPQRAAKVYRFEDFVALYTTGDRTVYIDPSAALKIAKALRRVARDVKKRPRSESQAGVTEISLELKFMDDL